jgi:palmitoyltransferase
VFGLGGIASVGIIFALPYIYRDYNQTVEFYLRIFGYFLVIQLVTNWLCMKFVDNKYNPFKHGAIPDGVFLGQNIYRVRVEGFQNGGQNDRYGRKDATAVNINKNGSIMYVASEMPKAPDEGPKRTAYPYFSWTPCLRCNRPRPPRCHHCPMCNVCVLKRDHHCFFAGTCIGYRNLRHFTVFLFWASVATAFATIHALPYYYYDILPFTRWFDIIFPIAILRACLGFIDWHYALFILLGWILVAYLMWATSFLQIAIKIIKTGKTTFEEEFKMEVTDTRNTWDKVRAVFGHYWIFNFIFPLHFVFEPIDDPVKWPSIKA